MLAEIGGEPGQQYIIISELCLGNHELKQATIDRMNRYATDHLHTRGSFYLHDESDKVCLFLENRLNLPQLLDELEILEEGFIEELYDVLTFIFGEDLPLQYKGAGGVMHLRNPKGAYSRSYYL